MRRRFGNLRTRLLILVVMAAAPAFGVLLYSNSEGRQVAAAHTKDQALRLAHVISADQMPAPQGTPAADGQQPGANPQSGQLGQGRQPEGKNESMRVASQNLIDALIALLESKAA